MKYTKQEIAQATAAWLVANPELAVIVTDDGGTSWAVPRPAREAIELSEAITQARSALSQSAGRA